MKIKEIPQLFRKAKPLTYFVIFLRKQQLMRCFVQYLIHFHFFLRSFSASISSERFLISKGNQEKQPSRSVLKKRFSENMQHIYRKTSMLECNFNKVAYFQNNRFLKTPLDGCLLLYQQLYHGQFCQI